MLEHCKVYEVKTMARVLEVSVSGYYRWKKRPISERERSNATLVDRIRVIHADSKRRYGSPRVTRELRKSGEIVNEKRVSRLMRESEIRAKAGRKFRPQTTDSSHSNPVAPNLLEQCFESEVPGEILVGDITYIGTKEGWLYLAVFIDLCTRMVVGWSVSKSLASKLVEDALKAAIQCGKVKPGTIVHTDRGVQYTAESYRDLLTQHALQASMSRRGNCYDNAPAESFFHTLKVELIHGEPEYCLRLQARREIFDYIEGFYNTRRQHSALDYRSPAEFEKLRLAA